MTTNDAYAAPIAEPLFDGDTGNFSLPVAPAVGPPTAWSLP